MWGNWTVIQSWWECKMGQTLWKPVWQFLKWLNIVTWPNNPTPRHTCLGNVCPHKHMYLSVLGGIIPKKIVEITQIFVNCWVWINSIWHRHMTVYYSAMKTVLNLPHHRGTSKTCWAKARHKTPSCMTPFLWRVQKKQIHRGQIGSCMRMGLRMRIINERSWRINVF